jgi:hypothetical protein
MFYPSKHMFIAFFMLLFLASCGTNPPGGSGETNIKADTGGVVEVGEVKLTIPPDALSQDAQVTLEISAKPTEPQDNPLQPAGQAVRVNLGGATLKAPATLLLPTETTTEGTLVVLETLSNPEAGEPKLWVHAAQAAPSATLNAQQLPSKLSYSLSRASLFTPYLVPKPKPIEGGTNSLQVPFYYQAGLPWCTPTSLSMVLNFYKPLPAIASNAKFPAGFSSNYGLASLIKQPATGGAGVQSILDAAGIPASSYTLMRWDAELSASDDSDGSVSAYGTYVAFATTGFFGLFPAKPVWTSSDRLWHAFVLTGVTEDGVHFNDSNSRPNTDWNGTHTSQDWNVFRDANCTLKDPSDPSKGCAEQGTAGDPDLYTLVFYNDPKPESERRGSIELSHGGTVYFSGTPFEFTPSLSFRNPSGEVISEWQWEGGYPNGYYFNDEAVDEGFPFGSNLVQDNEFKYLIYRSSQMEVQLNVVNVTNIALDYEVETRLYVNNSSKAQRFNTVNVDAYDLEPLDIDFGNIADAVGAIAGPTPARLEINLRQGGVVQDVKNINFKLAPDPTDIPTVRILVPNTNTTLLRGEAFTFKGEGFDPHSLPDGRARLEWFEGSTKLADGPDYTVAYDSAGTHTLTLLATGEYGKQASTTVTVNVIDPTRVPGEIVIVTPKQNEVYGDLGQFVTTVPLVGYATYSDGTAVPGDKLVWTTDGFSGEIGRGSSITGEFAGGPGSVRNFTIRLTALSADSEPIGSTTVTIGVIGPVR